MNKPDGVSDIRYMVQGNKVSLPQKHHSSKGICNWQTKCAHMRRGVEKILWLLVQNNNGVFQAHAFKCYHTVDRRDGDALILTAENTKVVLIA